MKRKTFLIAVILFSYMVGVKTTAAQSVVSQHFPLRRNLGVLCWSIPNQESGFLSQIAVFETGRNGTSKILWQSALDNSYSSQIRFLPEITVEGLPVVLVQRETGAASSELDAIGKAAGHFSVLFHADGFKFDKAHLDGSRLPFIIVHSDASILDVPEIYRWNGGRFVEDSVGHQGYYRELLAEDRKTLPSDASAAVLINLARIAVLSGEGTEAKEILENALTKERSRGSNSDPETHRRAAKALRSLGGVRP